MKLSEGWCGRMKSGSVALPEDYPFHFDPRHWCHGLSHGPDAAIDNQGDGSFASNALLITRSTLKKKKCDGRQWQP
jgi:hypothetical protein